MKLCSCRNPQVCKEGKDECKYCAKRSVHCTECGRPIREEKPDTIISIDMTGVKFPVQEPSEGEEITRVKRLYRGVINLDVEPNRYEFPNYEAADAALDKLLHSERTKIVGEIVEVIEKKKLIEAAFDPTSLMWKQRWNASMNLILKVLDDYKN